MIEKTHNVLSLIMTVAWVMVYILMIRRGFKDKSYGMPIAALCLNISWEFHYTFLAQIEPAYRVANGFFFLFDAAVLYTCFRFGKEDCDWSIFKNNFVPFVIGILAGSFVVQQCFIRAFNDTYGTLTAGMITPLYCTLMIVMLIRRNSVKGQSIYIGLAILFGDAAGYIPTLYAQQVYSPAVPRLWVHTVFIYSVLCNLFYVLLYYHVARRDGINPWKRL
jgi:hypothetical protein